MCSSVCQINNLLSAVDPVNGSTQSLSCCVNGMNGMAVCRMTDQLSEICKSPHLHQTVNNIITSHWMIGSAAR